MSLILQAVILAAAFLVLLAAFFEVRHRSRRKTAPCEHEYGWNPGLRELVCARCGEVMPRDYFGAQNGNGQRSG